MPAKSKLPAAEAYLAKACPIMKVVVKRHPPFPAEPREENDPYTALIRAVVFQQLSGKAAQTILNRVIALFPAPFPKPRTLLRMDEEKLRGAGLSRQKIAALKDIAQKRIDGVIPDGPEIAHLEDDEIIARLTTARGVGRWTVEMYLMFTLARPDVWPIADLGVRKGAERIYGATYTPKTLVDVGERFRPHRSAMAWHCWRALDIITPD